MAKRKPPPDFRDMAREIAQDSIVTQSLARLIEQIIEEIHETSIKPLRSELAAKDAEIERLRAETDDRANAQASVESQLERQKEIAGALLARVTVLEEALAPFVKAAGCWEETMPDETLVFGHYPSAFGGQTELRFSDFRRARAAKEG